MSSPVISFPPELPVSAARDEIAAAIRDHQVVIVAGATGSGKTTQLPKMCLELGRTAIGANTWTFHVPIESDWSGGEIERFLNHYGIIVWGRRVTGSHRIVTVKRRQAVWAEYLLLRRGISLSEPFCNPANVRYAQQHAPGDQPPAWADRDGKGKPGIEKLLDWLP